MGSTNWTCRLILLLILVLVLAGCEPGPREILLEGATQGTTYHIRAITLQPTPTRSQLQTAIDRILAHIDETMSNYREDSEISRFNTSQTTDWIPVSGEIADVVDVAAQVHALTANCYDLTVKPLFDLWGFSRHENRVPDDQEINQTLARIGMSKLEVDKAGSRLRKRDPRLQVDLSSIAQGYSVGAIARLLDGYEIADYMVEIGGELKVKGRKPDGSPWRIAIEKPTPFTREVQRVLEFHQERGTAVMTAGTYRNFFEDQGKVYSHILDPRTGRPVTHNLLSVTVLHEDPTWADAWDTALLCVGERDATRIIESRQLKALLIYRDGESLKEYLSDALRAQDDSPGTHGEAARQP